MDFCFDGNREGLGPLCDQSFPLNIFPNLKVVVVVAESWHTPVDWVVQKPIRGIKRIL